jgi:hypothetical protein
MWAAARQRRPGEGQPSGGRLGSWAAQTAARPHLGDDLRHLDRPPEQVDPTTAQPGQLPDAQATVGGDQDQGAVAGHDQVGQPGDLSRGQEPHLLPLDLGQRHPPTRRLRQHPGIHRRTHDLASFFTVIVWRGQAEHAAESLSKGSRIVVVGRLQQRSWTAEDGSARSVVEVVADELGPSLRWATATTTKATRS